MIRKAVSHLTATFQLFAVPNLFLFSNETTKAQPRSFKNIKLENIKYFMELDNYLTQNQGNIQIKGVLQTAIKLKYHPRNWDKLDNLINVIQESNLNQCGADEIAHICSLYPLFLQNKFPLFSFRASLNQRINQLLENPASISDENLISFMQYSFEPLKESCNQKIHQIFKQRIPKLRIKDYNRYLEVISKRKIPSRTQRTTFQVFINKYIEEFEKLEIRYLFNGYKFLKNMNKSVYPMSNVIQLIEDKIKNSLDDLDEKQIESIINYKSQLNPFLGLIYDKILQSIDEKGVFQGDQQLVFGFLDKLCVNQNLRLRGDNQEKFLKFLERNLRNDKAIIRIIQRKLLNRQQTIKLVGIISNTEFKDTYEQNIFYVYELISKNICEGEQKIRLLKNTKDTCLANAAYLGEQFMLYALAVDLVYFNDKNNKQVEEYHKQIQNLLKENMKNNERTILSRERLNRKSNNNYQIFQDFQRRYGLLYQQIFNGMFEKKRIPYNLLSYFFVTNRYTDVAVALKNNSEFVNVNQARIILQKVMAHPYNYIGSFRFLNRLLITKLSQNTVDLKLRVINYLCNWQVHSALKADELSTFFDLAITLIPSIRKSNLDNIVSYFVRSPNMALRCHPSYVKFLEQAQKIATKEGQQMMGFMLFYECTKYNCMTKAYAKMHADSGNLKQNDYKKKYADVVLGNKVQLEQGDKLTEQQLILFLRCSSFTEQDIKAQITRVLEAVNQINSLRAVQSALINLSLKRGQNSGEIIKVLLASYKKYLKIRWNCRSFAVLDNLKKYSLNTNEYKQLLQRLVEIHTALFQDIPIENHIHLLEECLRINLKSEQYTLRLIKHLQNRISRHQLPHHRLMNLIQILLATSPDSVMRLYLLCLKISNPQFKGRFLNFLPGCNLQNQVLIEALPDILSQKNIKISEPVFRYIVSKHPQLAKHQSNLILEHVVEPPFFYNSLKKLLESKSIQFVQKEAYGHKAILIGNKHIFFSSKPYLTQFSDNLKKYYGVVFQIPAQSINQSLVIFRGSRANNSYIAKIVCSQIPALANFRDEFIKILYSRSEQAKQEVKLQQQIPEKEEPVAQVKNEQTEPAANKQSEKGDKNQWQS